MVKKNTVPNELKSALKMKTTTAMDTTPDNDAKPDAKKDKKPLSAYMLFVKDHRKQLKASNPEMKSSEIVKQCGSDWKSLSQDEKAPFENAAQLAKDQYYSNHPRPVKEPKEPKSAYQFFMAEKRKEWRDLSDEQKTVYQQMVKPSS